MKPAAFDYLRPDSVGEALSVLAENTERAGGARIIAGGQSLTAMLNMRLATPSLLIDIAGLDDLKKIILVDGMIEVGAAVTQDELLKWPELSEIQPLLAQMLPFVGHYQTRQRGTVCGSIVHADPSAELPLALAVLQGDVLVQGTRGRRVVPVAEFQTGMMETDLEAGEMVVACRFPTARAATRSTFREVSQRLGDFAIVAMAAVADTEGVRLGVAGVAPTPVVIDPGRSQGADLDEALNVLAWDLGGVDDLHASARYRRELVRRIGRQIVEEVTHGSS